MPIVVNMHEAKTNLSKLVERARLGGDVVIAKAGEPIVRLVPITPAGDKRPLGLYAGKVAIHDDFDALLPGELMDAFR